MRLVLPLETPDDGEMKNVYSQGHFLRRISLQPSKDPHSAKCETAGDLPFLLLFPAIPKAREVPHRRSPEERQIREYARLHPVNGPGPWPLLQFHFASLPAPIPAPGNHPTYSPIFLL